MGKTLDALIDKFEGHFGAEPSIISSAPGRVEVLGNHTDYNEGYVLSAAINCATYFALVPTDDAVCRIVAGDLMIEQEFSSDSPAPVEENSWANYVIGVLAGLKERGAKIDRGFNAMFFSSVPLAAGLSSSAALEVSTAIALCKLYGIEMTMLDMAKVAQWAEHNYAGVKCGLMDQLSSLCGKEDQLVMTDFRTLDVQNAPLGDESCLVIANTKIKHNLVESEYNERRASCEAAAAEFNGLLDHDVTALRDVSWSEWETCSGNLDMTHAKRAAHVIGENTRVLEGRELLAQGDLRTFGKLMYKSHHSSQIHFENSCEELDFIIDSARGMQTVYGARLSGGGFGGSAVVLTTTAAAEAVGKHIANAYAAKFGSPCDIHIIRPSDGAGIVKDHM